MTAQINDRFLYHGREYSIAGISDGKLFDISDLGLNPFMASTACYRGYQAILALDESRLILDTLHANLPRWSVEGSQEQVLVGTEVDLFDCEGVLGPAINGVTPIPGGEIHFCDFNNHYHALRYHLKYTGGLLLADGFIRSQYAHMGFHPAWKYESVVELIFEAGILKAEFNRSAQMAEIRETAGSSLEGAFSGMPSNVDLAFDLERAFDRKYRSMSMPSEERLDDKQ